MAWDVDPALLSTDDGIAIYYYAVLAMLGYGIAIVAITHFGDRARIGIDRITWMLVATVVVALIAGHLVHLIEYEPHALSDAGRLVNVGSGQSSLGAVIGTIGTLLVFALRHRTDVRVYFDVWASGGVLTIPFIRLGNFINSELVGRPWNGPWAIVFPRYDCPPMWPEGIDCVGAMLRHPWPLYDALVGVLLIALMFGLRAIGAHRRPGALFLYLFGTWLIARLLLGFLNLPLSPWDPGLRLTIEQWTCATVLALGLAAWRWAPVRNPASSR